MIEQTPVQCILVPLDGSELATAAIPYARALTTPEAEVVLFRAAPDPVPQVELAGTSAFPLDRLREEHLETAQTYVESVAEVLRDLVPRVTTATSIGEPAHEILKAADDVGADLIVMASHGRGFLGRIVAGSIADHVARAAKVPVLLVHGEGGNGPPNAATMATIQRVVLPLDDSERARAALTVAAGIARHLDVPILLVRAIVPFDALDAPLSHMSETEYAEFLAAASDLLEEEAHRLRLAGIESATDVSIGPAAQAILATLGVGDIVVMASHGQGGVRRWLLGSVAERLIHAGKAPVVLVPVPERASLTECRDLLAESST